MRFVEMKQVLAAVLPKEALDSLPEYRVPLEGLPVKCVEYLVSHLPQEHFRLGLLREAAEAAQHWLNHFKETKGG